MLLPILVPLVALLPSDPIKPGDPAVHGSYLKPYENKWRVYEIRNGKETDKGVWTDSLGWFPYHERSVLKRTQHVHLKEAGQEDVTYEDTFYPDSLAPIQTVVTNPKGIGYHREFTEDGVTMRVQQPGKPDKELPCSIKEKVFDFYGGMFGIIFAGMKLDVGNKGNLSVYLQQKVSTIPFEVKRAQTLKLPNGSIIKTFMVRAHTMKNTMDFYLSKSAPYIIRLDITDPDSVWTYEMAR